jgi:prepilin-type N-terminal cleavage/methylation domain-containing protein/prepilin-type processing-associated H-X9-DG protein
MLLPPTRAPRARAFTLLELLSSIAIVAVLTALLVPTSKRVIDSGKSTKCASNLRQIGLGLNAYAADHDDFYPPVVMNPVGWKYWDMDAIWEYVSGQASSATVNYYTTYKTSVFFCPSSDPKKNCSYGMNVMFPSGVKNYYEPRKRTQISKPASCLLLGEGTNHAVDSWWSTSVGQPMTFPHGERQNLLFADLHVETRDRNSIPKGGWSTPETSEAFWTGN